MTHIIMNAGRSQPLHISASLRLVVGSALKTQGSVLLFSIHSKYSIALQLT